MTETGEKPQSADLHFHTDKSPDKLPLHRVLKSPSLEKALKSAELADTLSEEYESKGKKLGRTGGSDARTLRGLGKGVTVFESGVSVGNWEDVLQAIKEGRTQGMAGKTTTRKLGPFFAG